MMAAYVEPLVTGQGQCDR